MPQQQWHETPGPRTCKKSAVSILFMHELSCASVYSLLSSSADPAPLTCRTTTTTTQCVSTRRARRSEQAPYSDVIGKQQLHHRLGRVRCKHTALESGSFRQIWHRCRMVEVEVTVDGAPL